MKPCPTCGAAGKEVCVRGSMFSPIWAKKIPYPLGHDSRRTVNGVTKET